LTPFAVCLVGRRFVVCLIGRGHLVAVSECAYAMDCYRQLAEDKMAGHLADEVIQASTDFDGTERAPMRTAEARLTLGVIAARQGDLEQAVHYGERALTAPRKSLPTLAMVSRDLTRVLKERYPSEQAGESYVDQLRMIVGTSDLAHRRP
jgi:hypothetical protein